MKAVRHLTLVLGMHRSGTSAIAGAIHVLGAGLGKALVPPAADNPAGYFENAAAVTLNERLLVEIGSGWDDPRPFPDDWLSTHAADAARQEIRSLLASEFGEPGWYVLKDPRLCRLLPIWLPVLRENDMSVDAVIAMRNPKAITASLVSRDHMWPEDARRLTYAHWRAAEHDTRGLRRAVQDYDTCLSDPLKALRQLSSQLLWPVERLRSIDAAAALFDEAKRHHQRQSIEAGDDRLEVLLDRMERAIHASTDDDQSAVFEAIDAEIALLPSDSHRTAGLRWSLARERARLQRRDAELLQLDDRLKAADAALAASEALVVRQQAELLQLDDRLKAADAALAASEALVVRQQAELSQLDDRLKAADAALAASEALVVRQQAELSQLDDRLKAADAALAEAASLVAARDRHIAQLSEGLSKAESLAMHRLDEIHTLVAELQLVRDGLARAESLAIERSVRISSLEAELNAIHASWAWRMTAPLRSVTKRFGMRTP